METELKLKIAEPDFIRLNNHPLLKVHANAGSVKHRLRDRYYDTQKLDLWRHGITLRVREEGGSEEGATWVQTVKTAAASSAALQERGEWETALTSAAPQPQEIARQIKNVRIARLLRTANLAGKLRPVFTNNTLRTTWNLTLPDGHSIECALDSGTLECGGRNIAIGELELELKKGNPTELFEFALALHEEIPMQIANDSKAARGYALLQNGPVAAVKARAVHLTRKIRLEHAFRCMGLNCLEQMEANVPGVFAQSVESLHQMRVGLRRLRALLDMFADLAPLPAEMDDGVAWLAGELGATRDWDVLANTTLARVQGAEAAQLKQAVAAQADAAHEALLVVLGDPRYTQVVLKMNGWFYGRHWRRAGSSMRDALRQRARIGMLPLLHKAQKRLGQRIEAANNSDPAAVHRVRIAAKKARYAVEFFSDLLPRRPARKYISRLSALQDCLGAFNDLEVATHLLADLGPAAPPQTATFALGYFSAERQASFSMLPGALRRAKKLRIPFDR